MIKIERRVKARTKKFRDFRIIKNLMVYSSISEKKIELLIKNWERRQDGNINKGLRR